MVALRGTQAAPCVRMVLCGQAQLPLTAIYPFTQFGAGAAPVVGVVVPAGCVVAPAAGAAALVLFVFVAVMPPAFVVVVVFVCVAPGAAAPPVGAAAR